MSLPLEQAQFTINNLLQQHARSIGGMTATAGPPGYAEAMAKARYEAMLRHARGVYDSAGAQHEQAQQEMQARAQHEQDMRRQMEDEQFRRQQMMMDLQRQHQEEMMRRGDSTIPGGNIDPQQGGMVVPQAQPDLSLPPKMDSGGAADPNWTDPTGGNMYAPMLSNPSGLVMPPVFTTPVMPPGPNNPLTPQGDVVAPRLMDTGPLFGSHINGGVQPPVYTTPLMPPSFGFTPTTPVTPPLFKGTEMATGVTSTKPAGDAGFMPWGAGRTNVMAGGNAFGGFGASTKPTTDTWHPDTSYNQASRNAGYGSGSNPAWMNFMGGAPPPVLDQRYNNYVSAFGSPTWTANG